LGEVKNSLESIFEVLLSLILHACIKLLGSLNENSTHNTSGLHGGQHMSHIDWCSEGTLGKAPALTVFAALKHITCMIDDQLVRESLDNVEHNQECVPADESAHLHVKLQLKSFCDFVLSHLAQSLAFRILLDVPCFEVAIELKD